MEEMMSSGAQMKLPKQKQPVGVWILLGALLVAIGVIGWFAWMLLGWNTQRAALEAEKQALQDKVVVLQNQLAALETSDPATGGDTCHPTVTDALKSNIRTSVESQEYAQLMPNMASSVNVILAASEGVGPRTPAEAVEDMAYLNESTTPWDFTLPAATIAAWEAGSYTDYFDDNTYVGRASNGMVVVFDFDDCGKINEVFLVANEELLAS